MNPHLQGREILDLDCFELRLDLSESKCESSFRQVRGFFALCNPLD